MPFFTSRRRDEQPARPKSTRVARTKPLDYESLGRASYSEKIREGEAYARELMAEARAIHNTAEQENREPDAEEAARFEEIMSDDGGLLAEADAFVARAKAHKAGVDRLAIEQNRQRGGNASPLEAGRPLNVSAGEGRQTNAGQPPLQFQASDGRVVRALSMDEPFVPRQTQQPWDDDEQGPGLADRIVAKLTGKPLSLPAGQALFEGEDGAGGYLTGSQMLGPMIDLARPNAVSFQAGAQLLPMTQSEGTFAQLLSDPAVGWYPELARVPSSKLTFGKVTLRPKKLAAIVPVSIELLEDAQNAGQLIETALRQAMAVALDQAILSGAGEKEPIGVRSVAGVNTHDAASTIDDYAGIETAIEKIYANNYGGQPGDLAWIANPRDHSNFNRLQATDLQPLQPTPGAGALRRFQTTSLPTDLGVGENESEMIIGDLSQVVVGLRTNATVRFLPAGSVSDGAGGTINAAEQFATLVVVHLRADVAVLRPSWMTIVQGVKWS